MTALQALGLLAACLLVDALASWAQWSLASQPQRSRVFRHATQAVVYTVAFGGLWVFLKVGGGPHPDGPQAPWWVTLLLVIAGLVLLARVLSELRQTITMRREGV
jgi:hypothetical protein